MRFMYKFALAALLVSASTGVQANEDDVWQIRGVGQDGCGKWIDARRENSTMVRYYEQWVASFIVSYNYYRLDKVPKLEVNVPEFSTINAYLDRFCSDNPLFTISFGSAQLVQDLGGVKAFHNRSRPDLKKK